MKVVYDHVWIQRFLYHIRGVLEIWFFFKYHIHISKLLRIKSIIPFFFTQDPWNTTQETYEYSHICTFMPTNRNFRDMYILLIIIQCMNSMTVERVMMQTDGKTNGNLSKSRLAKMSKWEHINIQNFKMKHND